MSVKEYSNENIFKILSTESRKANLTAGNLAKVHTKLGELLSYKVLDEFILKDIDIQHVQGIRKGKGFPENELFLILVLMRGGLYVAEGFKNIFDGNYIIEFLNENNLDLVLNKYDLTKYNIIIVDSVINTGKSILNILDKITIYNMKKIFIISIVMQEKAVAIFNEISNITCYVARISKNFYIGKGHTDTGNRLFGTIKDSL
jgi:uracil phosphoribosyltransferase